MRIGVLRHLVADTVAAIRRAGLANTLRIAASTLGDRSFDRRYGTDTDGYADPRDYAAEDPRARRATFYVPTRAAPFLSFLRWHGVAPEGTFVDFGCGKGRAMMLAAQHGFRSVTGVELSPAFCRKAERNLELFQSRTGEARFEVLCGDAGEYEVREQDRVFYFYDPFDDELIERCLEKIEASLARCPRDVSVLYHNSLALRPTPFDRFELLFEVPGPRFAGNAFYLYRNRRG